MCRLTSRGTPAVLVGGMILAALVFGRAEAGFDTRSIGGSDAASIQGTVDAFRADLGNPNNGNAAGPLVAGRREINWDGGGTATTVAGDPFTGFQNNRGAVFTAVSPGTGFVQAPQSGLATTFSNATYDAGIFSTFSAARLFSAIGTNVFDVSFFVPGSGGAIPATVRGFGAVFTDVDLTGSTRLEFFDLGGNLLFSQAVVPGTTANGSLSFLGATANAGEQIFRVRITSGNTAPGPNDNPGGGVDIVMMDDFLFAEPQAVPEPSSFLLLGLGGALLGLTGRARSLRTRSVR